MYKQIFVTCDIIIYRYIHATLQCLKNKINEEHKFNNIWNNIEFYEIYNRHMETNTLIFLLFSLFTCRRNRRHSTTISEKIMTFYNYVNPLVRYCRKHPTMQTSRGAGRLIKILERNVLKARSHVIPFTIVSSRFGCWFVLKTKSYTDFLCF